MAKRFSKNSFTLVETMCVVAILGILIAVVTPSVSEASRRSKASECSSNLRTIQSAKAAYLMSHLGALTVEQGDAEKLAEFEGYFGSGGVPKGCPSTDAPTATPNAYRNFYDLYKDTVCPHNCPPGQPLSEYPYEPDIGGPNYYKNGYHDLHGLEK